MRLGGVAQRKCLTDVRFDDALGDRFEKLLHRLDERGPRARVIEQRRTREI